MTPAPRDGYRVGVPFPGKYKIVFNSDSKYYWGGDYNTGADIVTAEEIECTGKPQSISFNLPPLATVYLKKIED